MKINLQSRKFLLMVFSVLLILVGLLSVAYAALSTTLQIMGNAEVSAANWDIYLDNIMLNSLSVTTDIPVIVDKTSASFTTTLTKPGDFYEFSIDVVNDGTIDAMIESIIKTPELTDTQKKYLNYIVEYQNGESITTKQLVQNKSFVRLRVKVEFRKDISASELPTTSETLNLSFKVNYMQSDDSNENILIDNNGKLIKIVSGDYDTVGSEICIGKECFYVISSDEEFVTMFAKYNLYVGGKRTSSGWSEYGDEATGIQDANMIGKKTNSIYPYNGVTSFSETGYWGNVVRGSYVYNSNSIIYNYVENYKTYLESQGCNIEEARLIKYSELVSLGCNEDTCWYAPSWVYSSSYWTGSAYNNRAIFNIDTSDTVFANVVDDNYSYGVRPVIVIKK